MCNVVKCCALTFVAHELWETVSVIKPLVMILNFPVSCLILLRVLLWLFLLMQSLLASSGIGEKAT
jgi:hypothetical protein